MLHALLWQLVHPPWCLHKEMFSSSWWTRQHRAPLLGWAGTPSVSPDDNGAGPHCYSSFNISWKFWEQKMEADRTANSWSIVLQSHVTQSHTRGMFKCPHNFDHKHISRENSLRICTSLSFCNTSGSVWFRVACSSRAAGSFLHVCPCGTNVLLRCSSSHFNRATFLPRESAGASVSTAAQY